MIKNIKKMTMLLLIMIGYLVLVPQVSAQELSIEMSSEDFNASSILIDPELVSVSGNFGGNLFVQNTNVQTAGTDALGIRIKNLTDQTYYIQTMYIQNQSNWSYSLMSSNIRYISVDGIETSYKAPSGRGTIVPSDFDGLMVIEWSEVVAIKMGTSSYVWNRNTDAFKLSKTGATADLQYPTTNLSYLSLYFVGNPLNASVNELLIGDVYGLNFETGNHTRYENPFKVEDNSMEPNVKVSNYPTTKATFNFKIDGEEGVQSDAMNLNIDQNYELPYGYTLDLNPTLSEGFVLSYVEHNDVITTSYKIKNNDKLGSMHTLNFVTTEMYTYVTSENPTTNLTDKSGILVDVDNQLGEDITYSVILKDGSNEYKATNKGIGIYITEEGISYYGNVFTIPNGFKGQVFIPFNVWRGSTYGAVNNLPFDYATKPETVSSTIYLSYVVTESIHKDSLETVFDNWTFEVKAPELTNAPQTALEEDIYEGGLGVFLDNTLVGNFGSAPVVRIPVIEPISMDVLGLGFRFKNFSDNEIHLRLYFTGSNNALYVPNDKQTYYRIDDHTKVVETMSGSRNVVLPAGFDGTIIVNLKEYASDNLTIIGSENSNIDFTGINLKQINIYLNANQNDLFYMDTSIAYYGYDNDQVIVSNAFVYEDVTSNSVEVGGKTILPILREPVYFDLTYTVDDLPDDTSKVAFSALKLTYKDNVTINAKAGYAIKEVTFNGESLSRNEDGSFSFVVPMDATEINLEIITGEIFNLVFDEIDYGDIEFISGYEALGFYENGHEITFKVNVALGYELKGVKLGDTILASEEGVYTVVVTSDNQVTFDVEIIKYDITYILDGGTNNSSNPAAYTILDSFNFMDASKDNHEFVRWYVLDSNGDKKDFIGVEVGSTGHIEVFAEFKFIEEVEEPITDDETQDEEKSGLSTLDIVLILGGSIAGLGFIVTGSIYWIRKRKR